MKILFLDVDGVLNSFAPPNEHSIYWDGNYSYPFNDISVSLIKRLVKECELTIVLSSSWRLLQEDLDCIEGFLRTYDMTIFDETPVIRDNKLGVRGREIQQWLDKNKDLDITDFIIIDDDNDMGELSDKLILTKGSKAFTYQDFIVAKAKLTQ